MFVIVLLLSYRMSRIVQPKNFFTPIVKKNLEDIWKKLKKTIIHCRYLKKKSELRQRQQLSAVFFSYFQLLTVMFKFQS